MESHQGQSLKQETAQTIPQRFAQHVARAPDSLAIETLSRSISYAELDQLSNQVANAILDKSPGNSSTIAVLLEQGIDSVITIMGVLKAGKIYVSLDPQAEELELHRYIGDSDPDLLISSKERVGLCESLLLNFSAVHYIETNKGYPCEFHSPINFSADSPAYIFYTSGSTGQPKGVVDSHRNVLHNVLRYTKQLKIHQNDRLSMIQAGNFSGTVSSLFGALLNGATLCPFNFASEGIRLLADHLIRTRVTIYHSVPTIFESLVNTGKSFPGFRILRLEGDRTEPRHIELFNRHFTRNCQLAIGLGATETGLTCQYLLSIDDSYPQADSPIGFPVEGMELTLVDDAGREVPPGERGEILVKSQYLALGYWRQTNLTRQCFVKLPGQSRTRCYRTGDMARVQADGCLLYLGRKDLRIKIRGISIDTTYVELILQTHPLIDKALVQVLVPRRGVKQLVAYLKIRGDIELTVSELKQYAVQHLPGYMLPARYQFLSVIPTDSNGKVDRRRLPPIGRLRPLLNSPYQPPSTARQVTVTQCFEEILSLDQVGVDDDFYDLGGDSLLAMQLQLLVEKRTGLTFEQSRFIKSPDARTLDNILVESRETAAVITLQPLGENRPLWCLPNQLGVVDHYLSLARLLAPEVPVLGLKAAAVCSDITDLSIESMASSYLSLIRQRQESGPYFLCGNCFDGLLAFEIARQLENQGEVVEFLGLIDTVLPVGPLQAAIHSAKLSKRPLHSFYAIAWNKCCNALGSLNHRVTSAFGRDERVEEAVIAKQAVDPLYALLDNRASKMMASAAARYRPKPYGGSITLFHSGALDNYGSWRHIAKGGFSARLLPVKVDDHMPHLILHPMVEDLAREIRRLLL